MWEWLDWVKGITLANEPDLYELDRRNLLKSLSVWTYGGQMEETSHRQDAAAQIIRWIDDNAKIANAIGAGNFARIATPLNLSNLNLTSLPEALLDLKTASGPVWLGGNRFPLGYSDLVITKTEDDKYRGPKFFFELKPAENRAPNNEELSAVYREVRRYFKHGIKSENKVYVADDGAALTAIQERRNANAASRDRLEEWREIRQYASLQLGEDMISQTLRRGNCGDMTAVAHYLTKRCFPQAVTTIGILQHDRWNHGFLIVGDVPDGMTIRQWGQLPSQPNEPMVIDTWLATCCGISSYHAKMTNKSIQWSEAGKRVLDGERHVMMPAQMVTDFEDLRVILQRS